MRRIARRPMRKLAISSSVIRSRIGGQARPALLGQALEDPAAAPASRGRARPAGRPGRVRRSTRRRSSIRSTMPGRAGDGDVERLGEPRSSTAARASRIVRTWRWTRLSEPRSQARNAPSRSRGVQMVSSSSRSFDARRGGRLPAWLFNVTLTIYMRCKDTANATGGRGGGAGRGQLRRGPPSSAGSGVK